MDRVLVFGAGQLGTALAAHEGVELLGREAVDILDAGGILALLAARKPTIVINAAAYNRVDEAESRQDMAFATNATAPANLARACDDAGAYFVHLSSDYVFDGRQRVPYKEDDHPAPLGVYGASKLAGEHLVHAYAPRSLIVRTSGVFGPTRAGKGGNFVLAILRQARAGNTLRVVADKIAAPTFSGDLAAAILQMAARRLLGTVHVTNSGHCSWHEFASAIVEDGGCIAGVEPIATVERPDLAKRPRYSVLDLSRLRSYGIETPPWREGLRRYLALLATANSSDATT